MQAPKPSSTSSEPVFHHVAKCRYRIEPYRAVVLSNTSFASSSASDTASLGHLSPPPSSCLSGDTAISPLSLCAATEPTEVAVAPCRDTVVTLALKRRTVRAVVVAEVLRQAGKRSVNVGDTLVIEGDRGEDGGIVTAVKQLRDDVSSERAVRVLRWATEKETSALEALRSIEEPRTLQEVRRMGSEVGFAGTIDDVAFQMDRKKLVVYISRRDRQFLDFRKLQRLVFSQYRCRVWMVYTDEEGG